MPLPKRREIDLAGHSCQCSLLATVFLFDRIHSVLFIAYFSTDNKPLRLIPISGQVFQERTAELPCSVFT